MNVLRRTLPHFTLRVFSALGPMAFLVGCSGSNSSTPAAAPPTITSLSPGSVTAGAAAFTLTVNGSGFVSGSGVQWNGSGRPTTFASATQITAAIPAADVTAPGTAQVSVVNPDAQKSPTVNLTTNSAPLPLPTVASLSPSAAVAGSADFTLTVTGTGYRTGSQIEWNGSKIAATIVVSATQLNASIPASFIATAGTVPVVVVNTDTGDRSGPASFTINPTPARPTLSSLSPATAIAGSATFPLTVNGSGFVSGAAVAWAGSPRTTTFVNATQLSASIPASDIAASGTFAVDVVQASGRSTNQLNFTVTPVPPTLTSLSPATIAAGSAGFDLSVTGTGFNSATAVAWNGASLTTVFISSTQVRATIPADSIASARSATVDVTQSGIRSSNQLTFTITAATPAITSITPAGATVGDTAFTLMVNGTGFNGNSIVKWNGAALTTTFSSNTLLKAAVPASNLSAAATVSVTVENPGGEGGASSPKSFPINAPVTGKIVQLLSPNYATGGNSNVTGGNFPPSLSQDGRYVAFNDYASDLVAGDTNGQMDGFLRDTCVGSAPAGCVPSTIRLSADPTSGHPGGVERLVILSNDARYAAFDTSGDDEVDVRDNCIGASNCTTSIVAESYLPDGSKSVRLSTCCSVLSPDGRYILFSSFPSVPDPAPIGLYLRDTCRDATAPCSSRTIRVATGTTSIPPSYPFLADVSSGGRYILFRAGGKEVDPTLSATMHLFLQDSCLGVPSGCTASYSMVDVTAAGTESEGNLANDALADEAPSFSKDGRYVVFSSTDTHMIAGVTSNHVSQVYVRDTCIGAPAGCVPLTTIVSDQSGGQSSNRAFIGFRSISEHGRYVAYLREAYDGTTASYTETIMVRDTCIGAAAGCVPSTSTASADPDNITKLSKLVYLYPSISADGHYVAFMSGNVIGGGQVYLALTGY